MSPLEPVSRRELWRVALGLLGWRASDSVPGPLVDELLAGLLSDRDSARVVGREYLRVVPGEAEVATLLARLESTIPMVGPSRHTRREALRNQIRRDFERGHTVQLRGWVLSVTEARLAALSVHTT